MSLLPFFGDPFGTATLFDFPLVTAPTRGETTGRQHGMIQPMDIEETDHSYELYTDVPGLTADEISLEFNDQTQVLTVKAEHTGTRRQDTGTFQRIERTRRSFQRSFNLPQDANPDNIKAQVENGVLNVHIPKKEPMQTQRAARRIAVHSVPHKSRIEGAARTDEPGQQTAATPLQQSAGGAEPMHATTQGAARVDQPTA